MRLLPAVVASFLLALSLVGEGVGMQDAPGDWVVIGPDGRLWLLRERSRHLLQPSFAPEDYLSLWPESESYTNFVPARFQVVSLERPGEVQPTAEVPVTVVVLPPTAPTSPPVAGPIDPQALALTLLDVPVGLAFDTQNSRYESLEEAASGDEVLLDLLRQAGFVQGYKGAYFRLNPISGLVSIVRVNSVVQVFEDEDGPRRFMDIRRANPQGFGAEARLIAVPPLGEGSFGINFEVDDGSNKHINQRVYVRKRRVMAMTEVLGFVGTVPAEETIRMARIVAARMP